MDLSKFKRYKKSKSKKLLNQLILENIKLVQALAMKQLPNTRGTYLEIEDLFQAGHLGLIRSLESFDPDRGIRFSTYAGWWIRKFIQEAIKKDYLIVRPASKHPLIRVMNKAASFEAEHGRPPTREEIGLKKGEVLPSEVEDMSVFSIETQLFGMGGDSSDASDLNFHDIIEGYRHGGEEDIETNERAAVIRSLLLALPLPAWHIVTSVILKGNTYKETAKQSKKTVKFVIDTCEKFLSRVEETCSKNS